MAWGADQTKAGIGTMLSGQQQSTLGAQALQNVFDISPQTAELPYGLAGLAPAVGSAVVANKAVSSEAAANKAARNTVENTASGASSAVSDAPALANAGKMTTGTVIQTYWPPNGGFLGTPVPQTLGEGYQFNRYGGFFNDAGTLQDFGSFVAPADVPYGMRVLPPVSNLRPLTTYEVVQPTPSGPAAPAFGELGFGTQHQLPLTIQDYLDQGYIKIINQTVPAKP